MVYTTAHVLDWAESSAAAHLSPEQKSLQGDYTEHTVCINLYMYMYVYCTL